MSGKTEARADAGGREIVMTRVFEAPRELVWSAWTNPEHLLQWWGPRGFSNKLEKIDVRPGGVWAFVMHAPDGKEYQNRIVYGEIVKPERITYTCGDPGDPDQFRSTVTFEAQGARTKLTMHVVFPSNAARDHAMKEFGAVEGGKGTMERCVEHVEKLRSSRLFVMSRVFNAPREKVFRAWTDVEELKKWFGPKGFTMPTAKNDFREGGMFHYCLRGPDGKEMWGKWLWREIVAPRKLVTLSGFSNAAGEATRHPMAPTWPLETLGTTTFEDLGGKTKLTLEWAAYEATDEERAMFDGAHDSMRGGWTGTMEQLDAYLAKS